MLIAQLSDPHIRPHGKLYHRLVDSNAMFAAAVRHVNSLDPQPDLVLLSGDIVDDGTLEAYDTAKGLIADIQARVVLIPGNHDEREAFRHSFRDHLYLPPTGPLHFSVSDYGPVRVIGLDVTVPFMHHGTIDAASLAWLEGELSIEPERPTLLMMHQPPLVTGVPYLDAYRCFGGERLAALVARFPAVERVLCGHVHRFMQCRFGGTVLCTAPSTTTSIALQLRDDALPQSYLEPPALLLHQWRQGTGVITHLLPIGAFRGPFGFV
jgi:3',5'-cyclic AMP phosphodiesterase CpdA